MLLINNKNIFLLEIIGTIISIYSIIFCHKIDIKTYPLSIVSSMIYIYISYIIGIYANIVINICYSIINLYGWYTWKYKKNNYNNIKITYCNNIDYIKSILFSIIVELIIVILYYINSNFFNKIFLLDIIISFIYCIAMYQMVIKKVDSWIFWTIGNVLSIMLYLYNGMIITSIQYFIYSILSIKGFFIWKNKLHII